MQAAKPQAGVAELSQAIVRFSASVELLADSMRRLAQAVAAVPSGGVRPPSELSRFAGASAPARAAPAGAEQAAVGREGDASSLKLPQPPPGAPDPGAAAAAFSGKRLWTEERRAYLREAWPTGEDVTIIFDRLNTMAGRSIKSIGAVAPFAAYLGLKRSHAFRSTRARAGGIARGAQKIAGARQIADPPAASSAAVSREPDPSSPDRTPHAETLAYQDASLGAVMVWAAARGISIASAADLPGVNVARARHGLPPFRLTAPRARAAA